MTRNRLLVLIVVVLAVAGGAWFRRGPRRVHARRRRAVADRPAGRRVDDRHLRRARGADPPRRSCRRPAAAGWSPRCMVAEGDDGDRGPAAAAPRRRPGAGGGAEAEASATAAGGRRDQGARRGVARPTPRSTGRAPAVDQARGGGRRSADATRDGTPSGGRRGGPRTPRSTGPGGARRARAQLDAPRARRPRQAPTAVGQARLDERGEGGAGRCPGGARRPDARRRRSPGIVASLDAEVGETVSAAAPVVRIADPSGWRFETIDLDEAAIGRLDVGANATITVDAFEDVDDPGQGRLDRPVRRVVGRRHRVHRGPRADRRRAGGPALEHDGERADRRGPLGRRAYRLPRGGGPPTRSGRGRRRGPASTSMTTGDAAALGHVRPAGRQLEAGPLAPLGERARDRHRVRPRRGPSGRRPGRGRGSRGPRAGRRRGPGPRTR